jgi:hypothetical protein
MSIYRMMEMHRLGLSPEYAVYNKSGGGGKQTTTTTSKPYQQGYYADLLNKSKSWINNGGFDKNYGGSPNFDPVADMNQSQQDAIQGLLQGGGNIQDLLNQGGLDTFSSFLKPYDPNNTGLQDAISAANFGLTRDFNQSVLPGIGAGAQGAGQYGSTRHGVAEGIAAQGLADAMTNNAQGLAFQDQQNYRNQQLQTLGSLSQISKGLLSGSAGQYDAGSLLQGQDQKEILGQLEKWAYENNVELNDLLAYKELISGNMGGKNVTESSGGGGGSGLGAAIGSIGGAALGGLFGGGAGVGVGSTVGGNVGGLLF